MALPLTISGLSTAVVPVGPFRAKTRVGNSIVASATGIGATAFNQNHFVAQTFTPVSALTLTSVSFKVYKVGAPVNDIVVTLREDSPTGPLVATLGRVPASSFGTSAGAVTKVTLGTPIALVANKVYCVKIIREGGPNSSNYYMAEVSGSDVYGGGDAWYGDDLQASKSVPDADFYFELNDGLPEEYDGEKYVFFGRDSGSPSLLRPWTSTDPATAWSFGGSLSGFTTAILGISAYQTGGTIHIAVMDGTVSTAVGYKYVAYNTATNTFGAIETISAAVATTGQIAGAGAGISIIVRPTGEVIAFFNGVQTKTSGTFRARVYHSRRTAPNTWTAAVQVDANSALDNNRPSVVLGAANLVHFAWKAGTVLSQRTMNAANALQTASGTLMGNDTFDGGISYTEAVTKCRVPTDGGVMLFDGTTTPSLQHASMGTGTTYRVYLDSDTSNRIYVIYRRSADADLCRQSSDNDGLNWSGDTVELVANLPATNSLSTCATLYQRGSSIVLPYVVNDGGTWKYNDYVVRYLSAPDAWNTNDKSAAITLSNNDKTATITAGGQLAVRSTQLRANKSAGKYYVEFRYGGSAVADYVGVEKASEGLTSPAEIIYLHGFTGTINVGAAQVGSLGRAALTTDVACMAWDTLAERAWFRFNNGLWNNNAAADPATGVGGVDASGMSAADFALYLFGSNDSGAVVTVRTEAAELTQVPPESFLSWMGEPLPFADAWNLYDKSAAVTLSNNDKTATTTSAALNGVRSTTTKVNGTTGLHYAEVVVGATPPAAIGFHATSGALADNGAAIYVSTSAGSIHAPPGATNIGSIGSALVGGDVLGMAWDTNAKTVWFKRNNGNWNNNASANPGTGVGGLSVSGAANEAHGIWFYAGASGASATIRTEAANFTLITPAGFQSWMGETLGPPADVLIAQSLIVASPVISSSTFTETYPPPPLIAPSPIFTVPAFAQLHILPAPLPINLSVPIYTAAPIVQKHALLSTSTVSGSPVFGAILFKQVVPFTTSSLIVAPYVLGVPASMTQTHKIIAPPMVAASWFYAPSAIVQEHTLTPIGKATSAPTLAPSSILLVVPMFADNLITSPPEFTDANATIRIAIVASGFIGSGFASPAVVIHEINLLSAANLATGPPVEGTAPIKQRHALDAVALDALVPTTGSPTLTQRHPCVATSLVAVAPEIGASPLGQAYKFTAANLAIPPLTTPGAPLDAIAEGASTHLDLIGKTGYVRGVGSVGVETLIGDDPNSYWAMGTTAYYPDAHTQYGYEYLFTGKDFPPAVIGALRADIFSGKSVIFRFQTSGYAGPSRPERFSIYLIPFEQFSGLYIDNYYFGGLTHVEAGGNAAYVELDGATWKPGRPGVVNAVGFTAVEGDRLDLAGNKFDAQTVPLTTVDIEPGKPPIVGVLESYGAIASITTFDRLALADLKAKTSATLYGQAPPLPLPTVSLRQRHILSNPVSLVVTPVIGVVNLSQAGVMTAFPPIVGPPEIGVGTFTQRHVIPRVALAVTSPSVGQGVYSKNILPASITTAVPAIGTPALTLTIDAIGIVVPAPEIGKSVLTKRLGAVSLATVAPAVAAGVLKQLHTLDGVAIEITPPSHGMVLLGQAGVFLAAPIIVAPVIGTAAFKQVHALAADGLPVSAPSIGQAFYGRVITALPAIVASPTFTDPAPLRKVLTPAGLAAPAPVLSAPELQVSFFAADLVAMPTIGVPAFKQRHVFAGSSIAVLSPLTSPVVLGQAGVLQFMPLVAGQPAFTIPLFKQNYVLAAVPAVAGLPAIDESAIEQVHALAPAGVAALAPVLGTAAIGQRHFLTATLAPVAPVIATNTLRQAHRLTALPIEVTPTIEVPAIAAIDHIEPSDRVTSAPTISVPLLRQAHQLAAEAIAVEPPVLPILGAASSANLAAVKLQVGAPIFSKPATTATFILTGFGFTVGAISLPHIPIGIRVHLAASGLEIEPPASTAPALGQRHALATWRIMPIPELGEAQLGQDHSLTAGDLVAGRPVVRAGFFGQAGTMAAVPLWTAPPILPELAPRQRHRLAAIEVETGAPSLGLAAVGATIKFPRAQSTYAGRFKGPAPVLGQAHQFIAPAVTAGPPRALLPKLIASAHLGQPAQAAAGSPALGAPLMGVSSRLVPVGMRFNYPLLGRPQLAQEHVLAARDLAVSGPLFQGMWVLGKPGDLLDPIGIETPAPVLGAPRLGQRARLYAIANITGRRDSQVTIIGRSQRRVRI